MKPRMFRCNLCRDEYDSAERMETDSGLALCPDCWERYIESDMDTPERTGRDE